MDDFNRFWLRNIYERMVRDGDELDPDLILQRMKVQMARYQDATIDGWMWACIDRVPAERRRYLYPKVRDLLCEMDVYRGGEAEDPADWVAAALAWLRWYHQDAAGRTPVITLTVADIKRWLAQYAYPVHKNEAQMSLFAGVAK